MHIVDDAAFFFTMILATIWFALLLWAYTIEPPQGAYCRPTAVTCTVEDDSEAIQSAANAINDGRFADAEDLLRTSIEPGIAECRWEQFRRWIKEQSS
jgi:hypothetical protein